MNDTVTRQRWTLYGAIAVVLIFILAIGWQYSRANRLQNELAVARAEATLGAAALEAQRGSYEVSRRLASDFFTQLQASIGDAPSAIQPQLRAMLDQRDGTITMLSRNDAQSADVLARMFTQYRTALGSPEASSTSPMSTSQPAGTSTQVAPDTMSDSVPIP